MNTPSRLRCIVLEDEDPLRMDLLRYLSRFEEVEIIGEAVSVNEAYRLISEQQPDSAFMDIKLIGGDIFYLLERLKQNAIPIPNIIVTTGFPEYVMTAINDYHNHIVQYLVKPYKDMGEEKLRKAVDALIAAKSKKDTHSNTAANPSHIFVSSRRNMVRIDFDRVIYLEVAGSGSTYIVTDRLTQNIDYTLNQCLEEIFPTTFIRISRTNAVNPDHITHINKEERTVEVQVGEKARSLGVGDKYWGEMVRRL